MDDGLVQGAIEALADETYGVSRTGDLVVVKAGNTYVVSLGSRCWISEWYPKGDDGIWL